jgi:aryl-alcohol dehydrogenase-like predicted oxidoreductase
MRAMRTHRLGSQGPELSVIGYGAWEAGGTQWGPNESEETVVAAMQAAMDAGITWIDTAEVYGDGVSERLVGRAVHGRRDEVLIATKVAPAPEGSGFAPDRIGAACVASLERLQTDRIDLYQLHWPDETGVPVEDTWQAMVRLVDEGKVRHLGVSNFDRALIERCEAIRHVDALQQEFSMLTLDDRELIRWCGEVGTGVVTYGPLGFGLLSGGIPRERIGALGDWRATSDEGIFTPEGLDRAYPIVDGLRAVADRLGTSMSLLALAWNWHQPGVTSAIAGSRNADHVRDNAAAGDLELDETTLKELDALLV